ncbi:MAG: hypothetical protein E8D48_03505 [Nitrospira sp.]|nr:MAG: hypothetical protein E8D48_03505 [Nitrospira sp.]
MMTPARQRVWFEKTAHSIGGIQLKIRSRPIGDYLRTGPVMARGEPMQIIFSRGMYLRRHHKTGNVAAERRYRVATDLRL